MTPLAPIYQDVPGVQPATYTEQEVEEYRGNPWIEALPNFASNDDLKNQLSFRPELSPSVGTRSKLSRLRSLGIIDSFFEPYGELVSAAVGIDTAVRGSLVSRSPLDERTMWLQQQLHPTKRRINIPAVVGGIGGVRAKGVAIVGASSIGKTRFLERLLSAYPAVIEHREYRGAPLPHRQLVHLKLDANTLGSVKSLCRSFIAQADALLGTTYQDLFGANTADKVRLVEMMRVIAAAHGLGLLVVDEIDQLSPARGQGQETFMNELLTLQNRVGVPILCTGTSESEEFLHARFPFFRRLVDGGYHTLDPLRLDSTWNRFASHLWSYQVLQTPTPYSDELAAALHRASGGLIGIAVSMFSLAQVLAIGINREHLTVSLLEDSTHYARPGLRQMLRSAGLTTLESKLDQWNPSPGSTASIRRLRRADKKSA